METIFDANKELDDVIGLLTKTHSIPNYHPTKDSKNLNVICKKTIPHPQPPPLPSTSKLKFDIHNYVDQQDAYSDPPPFKISTITSVAILCSDIDLDIISKHMELNEHIRYVKYGFDPIRGKPTKKISKKKN